MAEPKRRDKILGQGPRNPREWESLCHKLLMIFLDLPQGQRLRLPEIRERLHGTIGRDQLKEALKEIGCVCSGRGAWAGWLLEVDADMEDKPKIAPKGPTFFAALEEYDPYKK